MMKKNVNKKAFTLVELVITIAMLIVLSTVSVPIYNKYVLDSKKSEGYALLSAIRSAQEAYYAKYDTFLNSAQSSVGGNNPWYTCNETVLGVNARGNKYFTLFTVGFGANQFYFNSYTTSKEAGILTLVFNLTSGATFK